jgi:hypothetical protein
MPCRLFGTPAQIPLPMRRGGGPSQRLDYNTAGGTPIPQATGEFDRKSRSASAAGRRYIWRDE